jgi:FK506-binding protein 1
LSRIGIDIKRNGSGPTCKEGDWTTVHWVGTLNDGRVVTDSRAEPGGLPKIFTLGVSDVFKCWDLAITQLHQGDKATLHCPSFYAWGSSPNAAPLGGEPIPAGSDVTFEIEILECNRQPVWSKPNT